MFTGQEQAYLEEERSKILARVDGLKHKVSELEQQLQETKQEVNRHTNKAVAGLTHRGGKFTILDLLTLEVCCLQQLLLLNCKLCAPICLQVEMEQALLQAERWAEQEEVEAENQIISQLELRLGQLNKAAQQEKDKASLKLLIHADTAVF